jgi:TRAP-type C4-dicarboxylate transport system permease small subunit
MMREAAAWLRRRAENIAAAMVAVMFAAFVVQIVFRYFFNFPVGWTSELSVVMWLWLVLWGAAFVVKEREEIRFDLVSELAGQRARIAMGIVAGLALVVLYGAALKPSFDYVTFMKVEKSSYLKIRMDCLFSIYVAFLVAVIVRYLWLLSRLLRAREPE